MTTNSDVGSDDPRVMPRVTAHELGHLLSLPDLYRNDGLYPGDNGFTWGKYLFGYTGGFDFMGNVWNPQAPELSAWARWQLGWIANSKIRCVRSKNADVSLTSIASPAGVKAAIVPLSASKVLVAESRDGGGYDDPKGPTGVLLYIIDADAISGEGPMVVKHPSMTVAAEPLMNHAPLRPGHSLTVGGTNIKVTHATANGFAVRVTR